MPSPTLRAVGWAFLRRGALEALSYRAAFLLYAAGISLWMLSFYFLSRFVGVAKHPSLAPYGGDYLGFGLIGVIGMDFLHTAAGACARRVREAQVAGTFEPMLATPTPESWVLLCLPAYEYVSSLGRASLWLLAGVVLFGTRVELDPLGLAAALLLSAAAFGSLGLLAAAATMVLRKTDPITMFLGSLSLVFSGVFYPLSALPGWARPVSALLPATHAFEALRGALLAGAGPAALARPLGWLALFAAIVCPVAVLAFRWALRRSRIDGSLGQY
jgi:ABC-2 type transport system permease protein